MRVLHMTAGNLYGGIESVLVALARHNALCPEIEPQYGLCFEGRLAEELRGLGVPTHLLGEARFSRPWTVWQARRRLGQLLQRIRPDVVVTHGCWPHALFGPIARRHGVANALWAHGRPSALNRFDRKAARTPPDVVIANSSWTAEGFSNFFRGTRTEVVYSPVVLRAPNHRDRDEVRRELQTPSDAVVIVMAARVEECKGHPVLLDALARLKDLRSWECWIAGGAQRPSEEAYLAHLRDQERRLGLTGRVRWLGQRRDIPELLAAADIHCQPNTGPESFGIAFVEAMAAALPVVSTAIGGALEIVNPSCGTLVEPGDAGALAGALRGLVGSADDRRRLGAAGPARAIELCDPGRQLGRLLSCLAGCVTGRTGAAPIAAEAGGVGR